MKTEIYFKYYCFLSACAALILILIEMNHHQISSINIMALLGLFFVSIEMGVLMTYEQLNAKATLKSLFQSNKVILLTPIGIFAHRLGQIGSILLIVYMFVSLISFF